MPPRRNNGSIRGPASALTSFLAGLGVEPPSRLTTWGDTSAINGLPPPNDSSVDPASGVTAANVEAGPSQVGEGTPEVDERPAKRARAASIDSDDLDAVPIAGPSKSVAEPQSLKSIGESMDCGECGTPFTVTAYTKEHPKQPSTWLCLQCCYNFNIDPFAKPKKAKAKPVKKDDRNKIVHYETRKGTAPLGELCIKLIGTYIEDVQQLGDIGSINMDKVCRIICKSRRLTPETAPLFFSTERTELAMYDCTNLVPSSYLALANLCPNLESLSLHLCGQMSTDTLISWGQSLTKLRRLELVAPFLVRKQGWISFFEARSLESFLITQSPRIDLEVVESLVKHCPNLVELRLSQIGQMSDVLLQPLSALTGLTSLDLSSPGLPLSDQAVIHLLQAVGANLVHLDLSSTDLTDDVLPAIAKYCTSLRSLSLRHLGELTDEAAAVMFNVLPDLQHVDMEKCHQLQSKALRALIDRSGATLETLKIPGWKDVQAEALSELTRCKSLKDIDVGWCRQVTDYTVKEILDQCDQAERVRVWGCNQLTDAVPRKRGVKVIGIETHAI